MELLLSKTKKKKMKKTLLLALTIPFLSIYGCNEEATKETKNEEVINERKIDLKNTSQEYHENSTEVIHLTKADFLEKVMNYEKSPGEWIYKGDQPCVIDFYADWCRPCKIAGPVLEQLAHEYKGKIIVYKIDTQKEHELASVFGIQSIPAFLWVPMKGKPQMSNGIAKTSEETKEMFNQIIDEVLL